MQKGTLYRYTLFHSWKKNYERIIRSTKTRGSNHDSRSRKSGSPLVREAKFPYCRKLIQAGCNIYAFQQGFFHAKVIIVDDYICDIGTANFDMRSLYINHEINCLLYDEHFIQTVKNKFHEDLENASLLSLKDVSPNSLINRGKECIGTILAFFL